MRKRFFVVLAAIALIATMFGCASLPNDDRGTLDVDRMRQSVVAIEGAGMGSGVIIDARGYAITNHHVIEDCTSVDVWILNGLGKAVNVKGFVVQGWEEGDLAVVKFDLPEFPIVVAPWGNSKAMHVGDTVYAIGHPYGVVWTATKGMISAVRYTELGVPVFQHDAMIGPGNSGGMLMNTKGELIGINFSALAVVIGWGTPLSLGINYALDGNVAHVFTDGVIAVFEELQANLAIVQKIIDS